MSNYTQEDFIKDIIKDFKKAQNKIEQKKKMRELIKLYGTTRKEIENKSTMTDWFSYLFAGGDDILKAVNEENRLKQALDNSNSKTSTYGSSLDDEDMEKNAKNVQKQLIKQQYHTPKRQDTLNDKIAEKIATGVERNHGLTKEIFLHDVSKRDVKKLPKLLRQNTPTETTPSGKQIYNTKSILGKNRRSVTSPSEFTDEVDDIISSDYWLDVPKTPRTPWK